LGGGAVALAVGLLVFQLLTDIQEPTKQCWTGCGVLRN
jgi:hypothetical protein